MTSAHSTQDRATQAIEIVEYRECPKCGARELAGLRNDCWEHGILEFVTRRYALVPIDGTKTTTDALAMLTKLDHPTHGEGGE